jgi:hypothetical protein
MDGFAVVDVVRTRHTIPGKLADLSDVRNGSGATDLRSPRDVRFTPESDRENVVIGAFAKDRTCWQEDCASRMVSPIKSPEGETHMAYTLYDAAVTPCLQQLGALAGIIDKAAAHCAANKIEESALLQDRLYPDMFCLARQIRQSADFAMNTGGRLAGVTPPAMPAVDDTSFAAAKSRVETALGFVKSLTRAQVDGAEDKVIAWTGGGNDRKMKGNDYLQQFALPNFFFFVTTAYNILRHRGVPIGKRDFLGPVNWL